MRIGMRTVKTVISVFFSMVTAGSLSLLYWPAAGIIALLSVEIQNALHCVQG